MERNDEVTGNARGDSSLQLESCESLDMALSKGAVLMKEEDAEILERGVRDSCSSGETPVLLSHLSIVNPPHLNSVTGPPDSESQFFEFHHSQSCIGGEEQKSQSSFEADTWVLHDISQAQMSSSGEEEGLKDGYRRCLSGEVRPRIMSPSIVDEGIMSSSPVSVAEKMNSQDQTTSMEEITNAASLPSSDSRLKVRSKSFDRRLNEAMQFAEAVGEVPRFDHVQVIIEETESDDDEDSIVEIHVDNSQILPAKMVDVHVTSETSPACTNATTHSSMAVQESSIAQSLHKRQKSRPRWPLPTSPQPSISFLHRLPAAVSTQNYVYKGICSNPPEITKHGITRGNYSQLHRKAWLEVSDKYHRYGKNLRLYYKRWESLGYPTNQFFDWLDSKGEAAGKLLPNLEECPRSQLDADTVHYISNPDVTQGYAMKIVPDDQRRGKVFDVDNDPVITGPEGWIFVLRDHTLYGAEKITSISGHSKQRFHHSSFFGGKAVAAAGIIITDENGYLTKLYPHSGHYRPGEADMQRMLFHLHDSGVDLCTFEMDTQQILHVTRHDPPNASNREDGEKKKKKIQSLHLKKAVYVACFLAHKARFIGEGVFDQVHTIRKANVTSVTEALKLCDQGGYWIKARQKLK
jgi:hypothetical protein